MHTCAKHVGFVVCGGIIVCVVTNSAPMFGEIRDVENVLPIAPPRQNKLVANLQSEDWHIRRAAFSTLMSEHQQLKVQLIEIVKNEKPPYDDWHERYLAVQLLVEFGSREAIPAFIKHVEYRQQMVVSSPSFLNGYPCAKALVKTGRSAVPHILRYLQVPEPDPVERQRRIIAGLPPVEISDESIELLGWVFVSIYGLHDHGPEEAIQTVRHARDRALRKENLTRLLTMVETLTDPQKRSRFLREKLDKHERDHGSKPNESN